jgi:hypothetical protein
LFYDFDEEGVHSEFEVLYLLVLDESLSLEVVEDATLRSGYQGLFTLHLFQQRR